MMNVTQLRKAFWNDCPRFRHLFRTRKKQNDYPADVRTAWCDYVDIMARDGFISEATARRATL